MKGEKAMRRVSGKLKGLLAAFVLAASFASAAKRNWIKTW
ncbi:hypothetical protein HMPREF1249_1623 [Jonquetella sp. BV3C21]|nr:hypothetical protein HMPREF1249_1623 [Jonquetella sp. BV3C21]